MDKEEARKQILELWASTPERDEYRRGETHPAFVWFAREIEKARPELLDFPHPGDKWRVVHSWIMVFESPYR